MNRKNRLIIKNIIYVTLNNSYRDKIAKNHRKVKNKYRLDKIFRSQKTRPLQIRLLRIIRASRKKLNKMNKQILKKNHRQILKKNPLLNRIKNRSNNKLFKNRNQQTISMINGKQKNEEDVFEHHDII